MWMHFPFDYSFIMCLLKVKVNKNTLIQEVTERCIYKKKTASWVLVIFPLSPVTLTVKGA